MSEAVYVRCRDAAFYRNPLFTFPGGFVSFTPDNGPEIVFWLSKDQLWSPGSEAVKAELQRLFTFSYLTDSLRFHTRSERIVPGSQMGAPQPTVSYFFGLQARIPRPDLHEGTERYASRCSLSRILDWSRTPEDVMNLEVQ